MKKILVIKHRHLGDVLLSSALFGELKRAFPDARIDACVWKEAVPMLDGHSAIHEILPYDREWKGSLKKEFAFLREIRRRGYDLVINLTEGDRGAIAALASGAKVRIGVDPGKKGMLGKRKVFTKLVKQVKGERHAVERDLDALRVMGIFPEERELEFSVPDEAKNMVETILASFRLERGEYVVIHPGSRWRFKCPPSRLFAEAIERMEEKVVLTCGPSERDIVEEIVSLLPEGRVINLGGRTSLKELGALLHFSKGLITVDSVPLHMASALKVPVVALFGPTSEKTWGPWRHPKSKVVTSNQPCRPCGLDGCGGSKRSDCLWTLSPQEVVGALSEVTGGASVSISSEASLLALNSLETNTTE